MLSIILVCCLIAGNTALNQRRFPDDFIFGTATASYQIEGGWNADDKSENIWDHMVHSNPSVIADASNGDVAADSYNNYKRDVEMLRELGCDAYRISLSWPRILPNGFANEVSEAGTTFYNNYINEMLKYNITPIVTIYHWDLPQKLQDLGGFSNPLFIEWFEDYARVVFDLFGDRVKHWITFNEPCQVCYYGYGAIKLAPMLNMTDVGTYYCAKHLVMAHAKAYHLYANNYKESQGGVVGMSTHITWFSPLTDSDEDIFAAEIKRQGDWALYTEPIYSKDGGFPKELSEIIAKKSAEQGYSRSRLPDFTDEEKAFVRGTYDFFGINHYTGNLVSASEYKSDYPVPSYFADLDVGLYMPSDWLGAQSSWLKLAPKSLYNALTQVSQRYDNPIIYITENGWSTAPGAGFDDDDRIKYYRAAWEDVLDALDDGIDVRGYMAWSLMDNFEWIYGYSQRFGLYDVDFESPERTRTPRKSAFVYKELIKSRVIDHEYEPDTKTFKRLFTELCFINLIKYSIMKNYYLNVIFNDNVYFEITYFSPLRRLVLPNA